MGVVASAFGQADAIIEDIFLEFPPFAGERERPLIFIMLREGLGRVPFILLHIGASTLNKMLLKAIGVALAGITIPALGAEREIRVDESQQPVVGIFIAGMRSGRQKQHVPLFIPGQSLQQLIPLVLALAAVATNAAVRLVHNHHIGTGTGELVPARVSLDVIQTHDGVGIGFEQALGRWKASLQGPSIGRGHFHGIKIEFRGQLFPPL